MKAPYRVLYSNDTTNIVSCISPFQKQRAFYQADPATEDWTYCSAPFTAEMLQASVDETVGQGIDVHLLQPGQGWVPWWKSTVYPFEKHIEFMKEHTGMEPSASGFAQFMAEGGDIVGLFLQRCRMRGLTPFLSFRLNDVHGHEFAQMRKEDIPPFAWHCFSPVHLEHPEWRLGSIHNWDTKALNWAIPEVREHKMAFIAELISNYDMDGFELDFMRHSNFFLPEETTSIQRRGIMNDFVRRVRQRLDEKDRDGKHRWLCVRVPAQTALHDFLGIDIAEFVANGVEMINLSNTYYTEVDGNFQDVRRAAGQDVSVYFECCHIVQQRALPTNFTYDNTVQRKTTPQQYYTAAHLALSRGCDGSSTFNFVYYRKHGVGDRGPASEPPFFVHRKLGDPEALAQEPQHYFASEGWNRMGKLPRQLPCELRPGEQLKLNFDMAPPAGGWRKTGRLRIQGTTDLADTKWSARLNGRPLTETADRSEPYDNPYPQLLGSVSQYRAWKVPPDLPRDGLNNIEFEMTDGSQCAEIMFVDLAMP